MILASYLPGEGHFESTKHEVVPILCTDDPFDYWRGIEVHWASDEPLINVEHDIELYDRHVDELLACPHPLCTWSYECHWIGTHRPVETIACGMGDRNKEVQYHQGGEEWAEWSAIGLVKIMPAARIAPLGKEPWNMLELAIEAAVQRPWHVHWPLINHHHW